MFCCAEFLPGVWDCVGYGVPAQKCPIVILLSDSPDNGLIGQWGELAEEISDKHKHKHSLHHCHPCFAPRLLSWLVRDEGDVIGQDVTHQSTFHQHNLSIGPTPPPTLIIISRHSTMPEYTEYIFLSQILFSVQFSH